MKRGDLVTVALPGDFGKPRPALVIRANQFHWANSVTVLPLTSTATNLPHMRPAIAPDGKNGLTKISHVMVDKTTTVKTDKVGSIFGQLGYQDMLDVDSSLAIYLGLSD